MELEDEIKMKTSPHSTDAEISIATMSDDISETTSIYSEVIKSNNSQQKAISMKRHAHIVQKLKSEIAVLKDSLSNTDILDLQNLQNKIRVSSLDCKRVKLLNNELKEKNQLLEEKLHNAIQREILLTDELKKIQLKFESFSKDDEYLQYTEPIEKKYEQSNQLSNVNSITSTVDEYNTIPDLNISNDHLNWRKKAKHYEKLIIAYEERIKFLEDNEKKYLHSKTSKLKILNESISLDSSDNNFNDKEAINIGYDKKSNTNSILETNPMLTEKNRKNSRVLRFNDSSASNRSNVSKDDKNNPYVNELSDYFQSLEIDIKDKLEKYICNIIEENREVDRKTIQELLKDISGLNDKLEAIENYNQFVDEHFVTEELDVADSNHSMVTTFESENKHKSYSNNKLQDDRVINSTLTKNKENNSKEIEPKMIPISYLYWSFFYGALCMILCLYIESIRYFSFNKT